MDPSSPHPVYSGTSPQPARTPHALVPDSFAMQETWQQGMAQQTQNAIDFRDAAIDRIEYTIDQNRQTQTDQALAAMQADFIAKSQLPNGAGGFYDANGAFNSGQFESWLNSHLSKLDKLKGGYIRPASQQKADQALAEIKQKASERMQINVLQQLGSRAQTALKENTDALIAAGQYDQAAAVWEAAPDYAASQAERDNAKLQIEQQKNLAAMESAISSGDEKTILDTYKSVKKYLTPANLNKVINAIRRAGGGGARIAQVKDKATGKDKTVVIPPQLPCGSPDYLYDHYKANFENLKDADVHQRSVNLMKQFIYQGGITRSENEDGALQEKEYCMQIARQLGVEEYTRGEIERAQKLLGSNAALSAQEWVKALPSNALFSEDQNSFIAARADRLAYIQQQIEENGGDEELVQEGKDIDSFLKTMQEEGKKRKEQVFGTALRQLSVWNEQHKDASSQEQSLKLLDFVDAELQRKDDQGNPVYPDTVGAKEGGFPSSFSATQLAQDYKESYSNPDLNLRRVQALTYRDQRAREMPKLAAEQLRDKKAMDAIVAAGKAVQLAPCLTTEAAAENLPDTTGAAYIAFPKGSAPAYKQMHFHNGNSSRVLEVREVDGISSPTLSMKAQYQLGIFNNNAPANIYYDGNGSAQLVADSIDAMPDTIGFSTGVADKNATLAGNNRLGGISQYRQSILNAARQEGIDPNLLAAIFDFETGGATSRAFRVHNNPGGIMTGPNASRLRHFDSVDEGLLFMAHNLKKNYIDKGLTTIAAIGRKYCPVGAANDPKGTNKYWIPTVTAKYKAFTSGARSMPQPEYIPDGTEEEAIVASDSGIALQ